jgi:hypothetical protein
MSYNPGGRLPRHDDLESMIRDLQARVASLESFTKGYLIIGTGAPTANPISSRPGQNVGCFYLRYDTPGSANQRIYVCTAAGSLPSTPPTWLALI